VVTLRRPLPGLTGPGRRARWRRSVVRRLVAAACLAAALWLVVLEVRPPPPPRVGVVTAARSLDAGSVLGAGDLATGSVRADSAPPGAITDVAEAVGRRSASGLAAGEVLTRTRLVPRTPAEGLAADQVALHVLLADPDAVDVVAPGQRVVVFPAAGGPPLARTATVLATDPQPAASVAGLPGDAARGVLLGLPAAEAERVLAGHGGLDGPVVVNVVAAGGS
jgi:pilus assembly protein CpaB